MKNRIELSKRNLDVIDAAIRTERITEYWEESPTLRMMQDVKAG